jgi:imidazolonepropionase
MGDLLMQAAVMSAAEKLSALKFCRINLPCGIGFKNKRWYISTRMPADMQAYPCTDYREILYYQGKLKPTKFGLGAITESVG